jgi:DNA polymerase III delta prime subunit
MNRKDQTSLLNLMESGILSELKHNQQRTTQLKTWVFASCNSTDKLLPPLLTMFAIFHFKPYTEEEFVDIVFHDGKNNPLRDVWTDIAAMLSLKAVWQQKTIQEVCKSATDA